MNKSIVCGVLVKKEDKFLLVKKQPNVGPFANTWTGPGGHVEEGETLDECVVRELYEETGIKASNYRRLGFDDVVTENHSGEMVHMIVLAYLADYAEGDVIFRDGELAEYRWVTYEEAQLLPLSPTAKYFFELANSTDLIRK